MRKRQKVTGRELTSNISPISISDDTTAKDGVSEFPPDKGRRGPAGFIADYSVLAYDEPTQPTVPERSISCSSNAREAILSATGALVLPVPPLRWALIDVFFEQVYQDYPVVEREDVSAPDSSILLQQAVCLAASLMRQGPENLKLAQSLYEKVKTLIYLNYEPDSISTLKTLCLLSCWSVKPPDKMSLDGPWYWTGVASRIAIQMGLHQESTYTNNPYDSCLRRIFWQLHNADKIQVACWGRPPSFSSAYTDVKLPSLMDFGTRTMQAISFIEGTKLCIIIGEIAELQLERRPITPEESSRLTQEMCKWVRELPAELHLYDAVAGSRNKFSRPVSELFIRYFATIILLQHLKGGLDPQRHTSIQCLIASSCMIHLYEEIIFREETCFLLSFNGFLCMVASLPQIYYKPRSAEKESVRKSELEIICSVMKKMREKYGGSEMVLRKILKFQRHVDASIEGQSLESEVIGTPRSPISDRSCSQLEELFPFPANMCSHMDLIHQGGDFEEYSAESFLPMENEWASWFFTEELGFMDSFATYPEMPNVI
ncbi:hypothetical protein BDW59DRAFT_170914 [Aspergillus cavernicola]|uniref:Xylanolytic transcriptional activator regulatory domain-containing protein n=1 Tax=Aspergillus cavernicola TaxID=176166 RepID=A0ABR4IKU3_9EURO